MAFAIDEKKLQDPSFKAGSMDIANPPMTSIPYAEFPRTIYNHTLSNPAHIIVEIDPISRRKTEIHVPAEVKSKLVSSREELESSLAKGWSVDPPPNEEPTIETREAPRRGRPPKIA